MYLSEILMKLFAVLCVFKHLVQGFNLQKHRHACKIVTAKRILIAQMSSNLIKTALFSSTTQRSFEDSLELLRVFHSKYGQLPKHEGEREDGDEARLAQYLTHQRVLYHKDEISKDHTEALESIPGFDWGGTRHDFESNLESVHAFHVKHGELPKYRGTREGGEEARLAQYLAQQRVLYQQDELTLDRIHLMESIPGFDWGQSQRDFEDSLGSVRAFVDKYGWLPRHRGIREDGEEARLARFLTRQRVLYHSWRISEEHKDALETIFDFDWGGTRRNFKDNLDLVRIFHRQYGVFPKHGGTIWISDETLLAEFLSHQRALYHKNELSEERIEALESISGFYWGQSQRDFEDSLELVRTFHATHGELPKRRGTREKGVEAHLANFLAHQKVLYHQDELTGDRSHLMESIPGFDWGHFEDNLRLVLAFHAKYRELPRHGGCREDEEEARLAEFLSRQRVLYSSWRMPQEHIDALETIPDFQWGVISRRFEDSLYWVHHFHAKYGELPKHEGTRENGKETRSARFLAHQRALYHKDKLSEDYIEALETIPRFDWGHTHLDFEESLGLATAFHVKYGELPKHEGTREEGEEARLARYLSRQRALYHKDKLSEEHIAALETISGFDWKEVRRDSAALVAAFQAKYGELPQPRGTREEGEEARLDFFLSIQSYLYQQR